MLNDSKDVFLFELNESLYFNEGQEIAEMIGISLDPEISIQPFNDYVSIRGVIELKGEYLKTNGAKSEDDTFSFDDYHFRRYLENVEEINDNHALFSHRFPVEISVPSYRVRNIDDITVSIESFDYEIPNESELKLKSSIEIHGISEKVEKVEEEIKEEKVTEAIEEDSFEFEFKEDIKPLEEKEDDISDIQELSNKSSKIEAELDYKNADVENESEIGNNVVEEKYENPVYQKPNKNSALTEHNEEDLAEDVTEISIESLAERNLETVSRYDKESSRTKEVNDGLKHLPEEEANHLKQVGDEENKTDESGSYLSNMLRGEEEESYIQMRVCIVQQTDTIETIADRYEISVLQLVNSNRLEDETVSEGQLLNIPQKVN